MTKLYEDSRNELINRSKRSDLYKPGNRANGKNRHQRRLKSKIANSVAEYNQINMNKLFKEDILDVNIKVRGETDIYLVKVSFNGFLNSLAGYLPEDADESNLDFRAILRSLLDAFNHGDVMVHCTCKDFQYRESYWATVNGINAGPPETRPSDETNPNDTKGLCKHINLVLNNSSWMMKVASVITNYIKYMKEHMPRLYADVIYPAIFEKEYEEPVQLDMMSDILDKEADELDSDEDTIDTSNKWAKTKNQFKKGWNDGYRVDDDEPIAGQEKMFDVDSISDNQNEPEEEQEED